MTSDSADVDEELSSQMSSLSSATGDSAADDFEKISQDTTQMEEITFNSRDGESANQFLSYEKMAFLSKIFIIYYEQFI